MPDYLLILRDHEERWEKFSPQELQGVIDNFMTWNRLLEADDRFVGAGKLTADRGVTVRGRAGDVVIDGPYAEAKEAIAGYYQIRADTIDDATEAAKRCPILTYGGSVEVRVMAGGSSSNGG